MSRVSASAPGKIVVCGEYAVLNGAPAVAMAIDRRARVTVQAAAGNTHTFSANGVITGEFRFNSDASGALERLSGAGLTLVEAVWRELTLSDVPPLQLHIDSSAFCDPVGGSKLGFGSSAAVSVALSAALCAFGDAPDDPATAAAAAHRRFQGDIGSGVDVATSICGGVIEYCMQSMNPPSSLPWPRPIKYRVLWSGSAADTRDKIGRLRDAVTDAASTTALTERAANVAYRWRNGNSEQLLRSMRDYVDALIQFDDQHSLGIFESGHRELFDLARNHDVVYKPCGAGGGDIGMALTDDDDERLDQFVAEATQCGFTALDVSLDTGGVTVDKGVA